MSGARALPPFLYAWVGLRSMAPGSCNLADTLACECASGMTGGPTPCGWCSRARILHLSMGRIQKATRLAVTAQAATLQGRWDILCGNGLIHGLKQQDAVYGASCLGCCTLLE